MLILVWFLEANKAGVWGCEVGGVIAACLWGAGTGYLPVLARLGLVAWARRITSCASMPY